MLNLPGNSEWVFANENSINVNPIVYAEWNYNMMQVPYVVASSSTVLNVDFSASGWTKNRGDGITTAPFLGYQSDINPTASAIKFMMGGQTQATFSSSLVSVGSVRDTFYKMVFYVKSNTLINSLPNTAIPASAVSVTPDVSGSTPVYYRISQVSRQGREIFPNIDSNDIITASINFASTSKVDLNWDVSQYRGPVYNIYTGTNPSSLFHLATIVPTKNSAFSIDATNYAASGYARFLLSGSVNSTIQNGAQFVVYDTKNIKSITKPSVGLNISYEGGANIRNRLSATKWKIVGSPTASGNFTYVNASAVDTSLHDYMSTTLNGYLIGGSPRINNPFSIVMATYSDTNVQQINSTNLERKIDAVPLKDDRIRILPYAYVENSGNYVESSKCYVKVYESDTATPETGKGMIEIDSINWKKVEVYFGAGEAFNAFRLDISVDSTYQFADVFISQPEVYKISKTEFYFADQYPVESLFASHRPGEALLNPYLQDSDKQINAQSINSLKQSAKPVSFLTYNPDYLFQKYAVAPYKQAHQNFMLNTMKYYVGDNLTAAGSQKQSITAKYNYAFATNKIVAKFSNAYCDMTKAAGSVVLTNKNGTSTTISFSAGDIDSSGILDLYYNGTTWSSSRPTDGTYPPKLTDSGILQNVIADVIKVTLNIDSIDAAPAFGRILRVHFIEISPRLEVDISGLIENFSLNKSMDDSQSGGLNFPMSYINSNTGNLTINNIPVYRDTFPAPIFDDISENATFYNLMKQGVKFTGAMYSPLGDFTDIIPMFVMYADSWSISDIRSVAVNMFDTTKMHLMAMQASDYYGQNESMFEMLTNIMDAVGFSDYDYDSLRRITSRRSQGTSHFWADRSQTIFEALQSYFVAHQIGAFFDEYGVMRFTDIDAIIEGALAQNLDPDFAATDIAITPGFKSVRYIPNIISDSYNHTLSNKIGKVSIQYQMPVRSFTQDQNFGSSGRLSSEHKAVWEESKSDAVIYSIASASISDTDTRFQTNPTLTTFGNASDTPKYTLGNQTNSAFLQGELINWSGFNYSFQPSTYTSSATSISASGISSNTSPYPPTASVLMTNPQALTNKAIKIGAKVSGAGITTDSYITKIVRKSGSNLKFTASTSPNTSNMVSTSPTASTVPLNSVVTGAGIPSNTYVTDINISAPSTIFTLSNKPNVRVSDLTTQSSSIVIQLNKSTNISNASSSTSGPYNLLSPSNPLSLSFYSDNAKDVKSNFTKSLEAIITQAQDLEEIATLYANEDSRITGITYNFTGRVSGMSRGNRFTSRRSHALIDDYAGQSTLAPGHTSSTPFFYKRLVSGPASISGTNIAPAYTKSSVTFDKNVVKFDARKESATENGKGLVLIPKKNNDIGHYQQPTSPSCFNYYSFLFRTDDLTKVNWKSVNDDKVLQLGLCVTTTAGNLIFCLENNQGKTFISSALDLLDTTASDLSTYVFGDMDGTKISVKKNVFDGKLHRFSVMFHNKQNLFSTAQKGEYGNMAYNYVSFLIDGELHGPYKIWNVSNVRVARGTTVAIPVDDPAYPTASFGFYVRNVSRNKGTALKPYLNQKVYLSEIYASNWYDNYGHEVLKRHVVHHWKSPTFLNKMVQRSPWAEPNYYHWGQNKLVGIQIYDNIQFNTAPIVEKTIETDYTGYDPVTSQDGKFPLLDKTTGDSVIISQIHATPFRATFAVVNNDDQLVYLSPPEGSGIDMTPLALRADYNKLTEQSTLEKIIDPTAVANSIQMTTKWIQTPHNANEMLEKIAILASSFNAEITISIFGNPLIQVGDICQLVYSLKNIGYDPTLSAGGDSPIVEKLFLVKGVNHSYTSGMTTELTLKPLFKMPQ